MDPLDVYIMKFKAVIFDLDGTLLNSLEDLADATNSVLRRFGYPEHNLEAYKFFVGSGIEMLVKRALPRQHRQEEHLQHCVRLMKAEYSRCWTNKTQLYAGVAKLLDGLESVGLARNILSNKADDATRQIVATLLGRWNFCVIAGARKGVPRKPDPTAALAIAAKVGIEPRKFVFIGDTAIDMQTARACGMYGIGVLWGFRPAKELIAGGARMLLSNPTDLLPWVFK